MAAWFAGVRTMREKPGRHRLAWFLQRDGLARSIIAFPASHCRGCNQLRRLSEREYLLNGNLGVAVWGTAWHEPLFSVATAMGRSRRAASGGGFLMPGQPPQYPFGFVNDFQPNQFRVHRNDETDGGECHDYHADNDGRQYQQQFPGGL